MLAERGTWSSFEVSGRSVYRVCNMEFISCKGLILHEVCTVAMRLRNGLPTVPLHSCTVVQIHLRPRKAGGTEALNRARAPISYQKTDSSVQIEQNLISCTRNSCTNRIKSHSTRGVPALARVHAWVRAGSRYYSATLLCRCFIMHVLKCSRTPETRVWARRYP